MKDRLLQLLDLEQLSPSKFADLIGVQRSSVSHVLSGRNKPSYDFLQKTLKAFPGLHADWLVMGKGAMYAHTAKTQEPTLFDGPGHSAHTPFPADKATEYHPGDHLSHSEAANTGQVEPSTELAASQGTQESAKAGEHPQVTQERDVALREKADKKPVRVLVFYEDNTFDSFSPSV